MKLNNDLAVPGGKAREKDFRAAAAKNDRITY